MPEITPSTDQTSMAIAMRAAGYKSVPERLKAMMASAVRIGKGMPEPSIETFIQMLRADDDAAELMWELFSEVRIAAIRNLFGRIRHEMRAAQDFNKPQSKSATSTEAPKPQPPDRAENDTQNNVVGRAEATPTKLPITAINIPVPPPVKRAQELHFLRRVTLPGCDRPLAKMTAGELRAWVRVNAKLFRVSVLLPEGMPDDMEIGDLTDPEFERVWQLANSADNA